MRLSEWPRNPYLNEELRDWVKLHLATLGVEDLAVFATVSGGEDDERRVLVATEIGLLDGWYAPRGSTARYSLTVQLHPWQAIRGVDLRGETFRLWAHEHQSRWRMRMARPPLDVIADTPELGRALAQFAAACSVMAGTGGASTEAVAEPARGGIEEAAPPPVLPAGQGAAFPPQQVHAGATVPAQASPPQATAQAPSPRPSFLSPRPPVSSQRPIAIEPDGPPGTDDGAHAVGEPDQQVEVAAERQASWSQGQPPQGQPPQEPPPQEPPPQEPPEEQPLLELQRRLGLR